jgi:hypothetical protein
VLKFKRKFRRLKVITNVTPISHNRTPRNSTLSEERNQIRRKAHKMLVFFTRGGLRALGSAGLLYAPLDLTSPRSLHLTVACSISISVQTPVIVNSVLIIILVDWRLLGIYFFQS